MREEGHACLPTLAILRALVEQPRALGITHSAPLYREDKRVSPLFTSSKRSRDLYEVACALTESIHQFRAVGAGSGSGSSGRDIQYFLLSTFRHI